MLDDAALPATLIADWQADEANAGKPFPELCPPVGAARHARSRQAAIPGQWTSPPAAPRPARRCSPCSTEPRKLKAEVVDLKEQLKRLKKEKAADDVLEAHDAQIREKDKAARDLEAQAAVSPLPQQKRSGFLAYSRINPSMIFTGKDSILTSAGAKPGAWLSM